MNQQTQQEMTLVQAIQLVDYLTGLVQLNRMERVQADKAIQLIAGTIEDKQEE